MNPSQALTELQRKFPVDWRMIRRRRDVKAEPGAPYYIEWVPGGGVFGERWTTFDRDGVFCNGDYNAVSVAQYALHEHQRLHDGQAGARERFMAQVGYLERAMGVDGTFVYTIPLPQYGVSGKWISGLAQGEAASVFFRAFALTGDRKYVELALRALSPLRCDISSGGSSLLRGDDVFFEEIAARPCHILNGHLCAAFAVWEACAYGFADDELRSLHARAVSTLQRWLPRYDAGGWSYYQLAARDGSRHFASIFYHQTHVVQLQAYAQMTGIEQFNRTAQEWRAGLDRLDVRARVWADSTQWLLETARRKAAHTPAQPWSSLVVTATPE